MRYRFYLLLLSSTLCSLLSSALTLKDIKGRYDMNHGGHPRRIDLLKGRRILNRWDYKVNNNFCKSKGKIVFTIGPNLNNTATGNAFTKRLVDNDKIDGTIVTGLIKTKIKCGSWYSKIPANLKLNIFRAKKNFKANFTTIFAPKSQIRRLLCSSKANAISSLATGASTSTGCQIRHLPRNRLSNPNPKYPTPPWPISPWPPSLDSTCGSRGAPQTASPFCAMDLVYKTKRSVCRKMHARAAKSSSISVPAIARQSPVRKLRPFSNATASPATGSSPGGLCPR